MSAQYPVVGSGRHTFEVHEDWAHPPHKWGQTLMALP